MFLPALSFPTYISGHSFILHQHIIVRLRPDLCCLSLSQSLHVAKSDQVCMFLSKLLQVFVNVLTLMSRLWPVFFKIIICSCKSCKMCICQSCCMHCQGLYIYFFFYGKKNCSWIWKFFNIDRPSAAGREAKFSQNFLSYSAILQVFRILLFLCNISLRLFEDENNLNKSFVLLIDFNNHILY